ncbi:cyclohexadienyl dehydrogenase [Rhodomicrobium udaipurense JA643]|uniref:prephenate dehydrogenase n=1 Tax=Rhodomicrobium udaipurense TaxID=1202716 RepID=A0A8I1GCX2_9HYPH|nr:prephenate/arogenate dehydrogenase family protein [Rhodomicrobium udaipurense]KAI94021.1 cyclohexadienyl dehydrogenase [Rhodomicrobium udaipurense JA643]MBJ7544758.1 prephenate/arogenate dehydrogenase family protein [Rhodomicrobium udaipurense]
MTDAPMFEKVALIGVGLIGSSLSHAMRRASLARTITASARTEATRAAVKRLGLADEVYEHAADAVAGADLVILCTPVGTFEALAQKIAPHLKDGAILSDAGSVKQAVVDAVAPHLPPHVHFIPGHPIAGTEFSGPESGFAELFDGRWTILTPLPDADEAAVAKLKAFWEACGAHVEIMEPKHHDLVLAITSHLPHLIAYNIVGTVADLEEEKKSEVIKFSASGFRDFTRIAASDPTMWRDIFINNKEAVLEILGRFTEDLAAMQRHIRWGEGDKLFDKFTRTRAVRRSIIDAGQESPEPNFGRTPAPKKD